MKRLITNLLFVFSTYACADEPCNPLLQKTLVSYLQCGITNLEASKLHVKELARSNPSDYVQKSAFTMLSFMDGGIQKRKQIIDAVNSQSITSKQAQAIMIDVEDREDKQMAELKALDQQQFDYAAKVRESLRAKPQQQKDLDITCEKQRDFAGSLRCRQN